MKRFPARGFPFTDIRDPKIDEKPPPYDCSECGFSTWSWNEAKRHRCRTVEKGPSKVGKGRAGLDQSSRYEKVTPLPEGFVEKLVQMTFKAQEEHPDWSKSQIVEFITKFVGTKQVS